MLSDRIQFWHICNNSYDSRKSYAKTLFLSLVRELFQFNTEIVSVTLQYRCILIAWKTLLHKIINTLQFVFPATSKFSFRSSHAYNQLFPIYCVSLFSIINKLLDDSIQNKIICMLMLNPARMGEMGVINMHPSS